MNRENTTEQNATKGPRPLTEYVYEDMRKNPGYSRVGHQPCPQAWQTRAALLWKNIQKEFDIRFMFFIIYSCQLFYILLLFMIHFVS